MCSNLGSLCKLQQKYCEPYICSVAGIVLGVYMINVKCTYTSVLGHIVYSREFI